MSEVWLLFANGGRIPFCLVVKDLGPLDTRRSMVFHAARGIFRVFLARAHIQMVVSSELYDSAVKRLAVSTLTPATASARSAFRRREWPREDVSLLSLGTGS